MSQLSAVDLFRQAMNSSRAGDKAKTRELLRQAVQVDPHSETTWQWLAGVLEDPLEATQAWEKVLSLNPKNEKAKLAIRPVRLQAGIICAKAKDIETARRLLRAVVADDPKNEHGWLWLASVSSSPVEAKAHLERVLTLNPNSKAAKKGIEYYERKIKKQEEELRLRQQGSGRQGASSSADTIQSTTGSQTTIVTRNPADEPHKALIVDASRTHRKLLGMALAFDSYTIIEAEDADEAIERIRDEGVPDLILIDSKLSGLDPFEFCKLLRQHPDTLEVPVILMNGPSITMDRYRSTNAGINAIVRKPIHPETLLETTRQFHRVV